MRDVLMGVIDGRAQLRTGIYINVKPFIEGKGGRYVGLLLFCASGNESENLRQSQLTKYTRKVAEYYLFQILFELRLR